MKDWRHGRLNGAFLGTNITGYGQFDLAPLAFPLKPDADIRAARQQPRKSGFA
jgi:hypothetical protein